MQAVEIGPDDEPLNRLIAQLEKTGEDVVLQRQGTPVARVTRPVSASTDGNSEEVVELFRRIRERVRDDWPDEPEFDWKAAIEEGRA